MAGVMEEVVGAVLAVMDALVVVKEVVLAPAKEVALEAARAVVALVLINATIVVLEDANRHVLVVLVSVAEIVILVVKAVVMLNALVIV